MVPLSRFDADFQGFVLIGSNFDQFSVFLSSGGYLEIGCDSSSRILGFLDVARLLGFSFQDLLEDGLSFLSDFVGNLGLLGMSDLLVSFVNCLL